MSLRSRAVDSTLEKAAHNSTEGRDRERGATLTEYAMLTALVVVVSIAAITTLQDESGSYLVETGSDIGTPREVALNFDVDLPSEPPWLTPPPPPIPSHPVGVVLIVGAIKSTPLNGCYQVVAPGLVGSTLEIQACDGSDQQRMEFVGTGQVGAFRSVDPVNVDLCPQVDPLTGLVDLQTCDGSAEQEFTYGFRGAGLDFVSLATGNCLTATPTVLTTAPCDPLDLNQEFTLS